jgi:RIO kinase 1
MAFREKEKEKKEDLLKTYKNVFDEGTMNALWYLITHRKIEGLESPVKLGKESNVFSALTKDRKRVAVKIYRIASADFFKMSQYLGMDTRFRKPERKKQVVLTWARREFSNLLRAYKASVNVPAPIAIKENIVIMEFLGTKSDNMPVPFPLMKDIVDSENALRIYRQFIEEVRELYKAGLVHGDLSEFNVLMDGEKPILIDLSHAITVLAPAAQDLLNRDIDNIVRFFKKKGLNLNKEDIKEYIKS